MSPSSSSRHRRAGAGCTGVGSGDDVNSVHTRLRGPPLQLTSSSSLSFSDDDTSSLDASDLQHGHQQNATTSQGYPTAVSHTLPRTCRRTVAVARANNIAVQWTHAHASAARTDTPARRHGTLAAPSTSRVEAVWWYSRHCWCCGCCCSCVAVRTSQTKVSLTVDCRAGLVRGHWTAPAMTPSTQTERAIGMQLAVGGLQRSHDRATRFSFLPKCAPECNGSHVD